MTTKNTGLQTTEMEDYKTLDAEIIQDRTPVIMEGNTNMIQDLTKPSKLMYCSLVPKTREEKVMLFNATNESDSTISDSVNKILQIVHVFAEEIYFTNELTGEVEPCARLVFIDKDNKSYSCASKGMFSSLKKAFATFGTPDTWLEPLPILIKNKTIGKNKMLTFTVQ